MFVRVGGEAEGGWLGYRPQFCWSEMHFNMKFNKSKKKSHKAWAIDKNELFTSPQQKYDQASSHNKNFQLRTS